MHPCCLMVPSRGRHCAALSRVRFHCAHSSFEAVLIGERIPLRAALRTLLHLPPSQLTFLSPSQLTFLSQYTLLVLMPVKILNSRPPFLRISKMFSEFPFLSPVAGRGEGWGGGGGEGTSETPLPPLN